MSVQTSLSDSGDEFHDCKEQLDSDKDATHFNHHHHHHQRHQTPPPLHVKTNQLLTPPLTVHHSNIKPLGNQPPINSNSSGSNPSPDDWYLKTKEHSPLSLLHRKPTHPIHDMCKAVANHYRQKEKEKNNRTRSIWMNPPTLPNNPMEREYLQVHDITGENNEVSDDEEYSPSSASSQDISRASSFEKSLSSFSGLGIRPSVSASDLPSIQQSPRRYSDRYISSIFSNEKWMAPLQFLRVRTKHKPSKEFSKLFIAQELFQTTTGVQNILTPEENAAGNAIWCMRCSSDGTYLACGGQNKNIWVWSLKGEENIIEENSVQEEKNEAGVFEKAPFRVYKGHSSDILEISWSRNNFLISSSIDKTVRLWHVRREECLCCFQHRDFVTSIAFHPNDDRFILTGSLDCKLRIWSIPDKQVLYWVELPSFQIITAVGFTRNGYYAIAGTYLGKCFFYESEGLNYHTQISVTEGASKRSGGKKITGIEAFPNCIQKQDEEKILVTSNDGRIRLYDLRDKTIIHVYKGLTNSSSQIKGTFSYDGRYIISGSEDKFTYIWNTFVTKSMEPGKKQDLMLTIGNPIPRSFTKKLARVHDIIKQKLSLSPKVGYECFQGHDSIVTSAIFLPAGGYKQLNQNSILKQSKIEQFPDGAIIISADYEGRIRILRNAFPINYTSVQNSTLMNTTNSRRPSKLQRSVSMSIL